MSENITLTESAAAIVKADVAAFERDTTRYAAYVADMDVTAETLAMHVAIFRNAYRSAKPKADGAKVKAYATKVRNGLNYHVAKSESSAKRVPTALITSLGAKATLEAVVAAWEAAQN